MNPVSLACNGEILVGRRWRRGSGSLLVSASPLDGSEIARLHGADAADVDEAVQDGARAARDPSWRDLLPHERARFLVRIADLIAGHAGALAALQTLDTGKSIRETAALVASAQAAFRYFAAALETMDETLTTPRGPYLTMSVHDPVGVVGAITPWNSPIASDAQKLAPALAAGNAVLLKPAEWTPLVSLALGRLITASGLPAGLVSVLPGPGPVTGDAIVRHPCVGKVSFTGGTQTGRAIGAIAARKVMPVSLELGGKSPTIVFPDADLGQAVAGVRSGSSPRPGRAASRGAGSSRTPRSTTGWSRLSSPRPSSCASAPAVIPRPRWRRWCTTGTRSPRWLSAPGLTARGCCAGGASPRNRSTSAARTTCHRSRRPPA